MDKQQRLHQLNRMKFLATALLVAMGLLWAVARFQKEAGVWGWVAAFAEAAVIGALADWFAVVALFRHPLKLPIPRTAIIPHNKDRIADNLAAFIRDNFLGVETMVEKVRLIQPGRRIAVWLSQREKADFVADKLMLLLRGTLYFVNDERVSNLLRRAISQRLQEMDVGNSAGQLLDVLTQDGQHQAILDEVLRRVSTILDDPETQRTMSSMIIEMSKREYPKLTKLLGIVVDTEDFGLKMSASLVESIQNWLHDIGDDPNHPRRKQFDQVVANFIEHMKNDPNYHRKIGEWKQQLLSTPVVADYFEGLWVQFKEWLLKDIASEDSQTHTRLAHGMRHLGRWMADNPELCESIDDHTVEAVRAMSGELRETISRHIANTVRQWEDTALVRELELSVGRDLQFIRINGTLVGGFIGLVLHALVTMPFVP